MRRFFSKVCEKFWLVISSSFDAACDRLAVPPCCNAGFTGALLVNHAIATALIKDQDYMCTLVKHVRAMFQIEHWLVTGTPVFAGKQTSIGSANVKIRVEWSSIVRL